MSLDKFDNNLSLVDDFEDDDDGHLCGVGMMTMITMTTLKTLMMWLLLLLVVESSSLVVIVVVVVVVASNYFQYNVDQHLVTLVIS